MTQSDVMAEAKQGKPTAIAVLLNRALQKQSITVNTSLDETCLTIELSSQQPIPQAAAIALIQQGMIRLQPRLIESVVVCARIPEGSEFDWIESFLLNTPIEKSIANADANTSEKMFEKSKNALLAKRGEALAQPLLPKLGEGELQNFPPRTKLGEGNTRGEGGQQAVVRHVEKMPSLRPNQISTTGWGALLSGLILAIALFSIGFLNGLFHGFLVLVHEVGHAATHWMFGRPAIPTVNILFGGGITLVGGQVALLVFLMYAGLGYLAYRSRAYPRFVGVLIGFGLVYTVCLLTPLNQMLSTFMGHGMELVAIALCLYFATSGHFCRIPGDRTIYAMLGFFTLFSNLRFLWRLMHDSEYRAWYEGGIGGMLDNDLVILATQYFRVDLSTVAESLLLVCFVMPAIAFLAFRYEPWGWQGLHQLFKR